MHGWQERDVESKQDHMVSSAKAAELDSAKAETMPELLKETSGMRPFEQIKFQPVRAHGLFDAEFAVKGDDIIFHFWPYGFHQAQHSGTREPNFPTGFLEKLKESLKTSFAATRTEVTLDKDMGAYFVKAIGYATAISSFTLATEACKHLYKLLGGQG